MFDTHEIIPTKDGVLLVNTITVEGFLSRIWIWLVANDIANFMPEKMQNMVDMINKNKN